MLPPQPDILGPESSSVASSRLPASVSSGSELADEVVPENVSQQSSQSSESAGIIFSPPTPPCLVFFAVEEDSSRSFVVIESKYMGHSISRSLFFCVYVPRGFHGTNTSLVDGLTILNKDLCDCFDPRKDCLKAVIERTRSSILVSKSKDVMDPNDWNIAHAGKYQRKDALESIKRMKSIVLEFDSTQGKIGYR
jgi:hypothetical protein